MKNATKYLSQECQSNPWFVDRLIISAFLYINKIDVLHNQFVIDYLITENDEDYFTLEEFIKLIKKEKDYLDIEDVIELFEFVISPSDRIVNGAIYTPSEIREYIISETFNKNINVLQQVKIADISCGCSGFLYTAAVELNRLTGNNYQSIFQNQIFGLDIQEYSVTRSKLLLSLLALKEGEDIEEFYFNIHQGDALTFRWDQYYDDFEGFQIIVGNPPYVCARNLDDAVKENLQNWIVCNSGNPDLYIPFFQIGFENLSINGVLGYITMNTFFKSLNGRSLRRYFEDNMIGVKIIDFGTQQIFKSKSTYTCICFLENTQKNHVQYYRSVKKELPEDANDFKTIYYGDLNAKKGWNLHNNKIISRIEAVGKSFGEIYSTRHGIATLKNDIYIFKPVAEDNDFYYLQNGDLYPIEKGICKDILNSNKLSRSINFEEVKEKVLFPYDNKIKPKALDEDFLKEMYPNAYEYFKRKKKILAMRDKGKGEYEKWFAFGRTQSLEQIGNKIFFPKFSDKIPTYLISSDVDLLFYNGQAIVGHTVEEMIVIKKILQSRLFWFYIKSTSKPYSSEYYSLNGNYMKNFGIPNFNEEEINFLMSEENQEIIDVFLEDYYGVHLNADLVLNQ
ncbi:Eco57I restriction-modification methylase domain-containing protein [Chryseobacterium shigense]|uniref:site-specific DNA-methyltransferase (adenine-specific) n=1 Tax=Chryseobacterium shigense TaxID=297244 RepID=A0A841N5Z5_9FLAO|nr:N-6 DNA methylase [Chryseobacterium shigense]MBB6372284.1 hypothetical protein [Chryseobacterium shigense]